MSRICAGRLLYNVGAAAENDLAPNVANIRKMFLKNKGKVL